MVVRLGTETSTAASSATFLLIDAIWVIFSALDSLSLTMSLSLCFALLWDCWSTQMQSAFLNEEDPSFLFKIKPKISKN